MAPNMTAARSIVTGRNQKNSSSMRNAGIMGVINSQPVLFRSCSRRMAMPTVGRKQPIDHTVNNIRTAGIDSTCTRISAAIVMAAKTAK